MIAPIRLAVIDDHPLFREGVARCLRDMDFEIVAPGISCRQQIEYLAGRTAKHPAELLVEVLSNES